MDKKKPSKPRVPLPNRGLQVNFCKNHLCKNFGRPASTEKQPRGPGAQSRSERDSYVIGARGKGKPQLKCGECGQKMALKSNMAINEELFRLSNFLELAPLPACPNLDCPNHTVTLKNNPKEYYKHSRTKAGSKRFRCKKCGTTFSLPAPNLYQKQPHVTLEIFRLLVHKMPIRKMCKKTDISTGSFYAKVDYIHQQCLKFVANREWRLLEGMPLKNLRISVDRQEYMVNWSQRGDRRTTVIQAVGSADNKSRYIFGMHSNFDPSFSQEEVEILAKANGDLELPAPFRRLARIWLLKDYEESLSSTSVRPGNEDFGTVQSLSRDENRDELDQGENEDFEQHTKHTRLPSRSGVQTHSDYTLYAHFLFLRRLLKGSPHITFYMDNEPGIRSACFAAFLDRILERSCDAFFVSINKDLNNDELEAEARRVRKEFLAYIKARPALRLEDVKEYEVKQMMMVDRISGKKAAGLVTDPGIFHPYPSKNEPQMKVTHLTDYGDYSDDELGWMYFLASLRGIDGFFQKIRRDMSPLERPTPTASSNRKIWYGYSFYNPAMVQKLLDIYRVFYNYVEVGKDKKTPAMRLKLAKAPISFEDILYH